MQRRDFLTGAAAATVAGAAAGSFPKPALSQGMRQLKMVTTWPKNFPGLGTGAERVAQRITKASGGKLTVKVFAAGELVPPFESFDAVSGGTADLYHAADYYWQGKSKAYPYFCTVPYGFTATEIDAWLHHGGGQELWDELGAEFNVKGLPAGNTGVQMGGWFRQPVTSLDDMKGLKFRMPGLGGEVLRQIGVSVVNLPGGEIFPALQSGAIDGTEWVGPWNDLAFGFYKITKHYYYPGFHEPGPVLSCGVNFELWNSLSEDERQIITDACLAENNYTLAEFNARNGDSLNTLINEHGVQLHKFDSKILQEIGEAAGDVMADTAKEGGIVKKVYDSYIDFRKKAISWSKLADQGYWNARLLPFTYAE